jgi:anti-sigma-K factor RskA
MNCNELHDHYELYAIGVADEPERSEIHAHLNRDCEVCMEGIKRAREVAALLGSSAAPAAPSPKLRRRILASVGGEERRFGWAPFLAGALALSLFAVVYFGGRERDLGNELARVRDINRQQSIELTRVSEAFAIVNGADTTVTTFGEGQPQPKGKVFWSPSQGVLLIASNLRPAPAGKAYEMWLIPKGGKPKPAGMFQSSSDGSAMHIQRGSAPDTDLVAVTLENEAGSDQPTSTPLFAAPIHALVQ